MKRVILLQSPKNLFNVVPIFYKTSKDLGLFDHFYIVTDHPEAKKMLPNDDCTILVKDKDEQYASNMLDLVKVVDENLFFVSCEDFIMDSQTKASELEDALEFISKTEKVGYLRLSYHDKIMFRKKRGKYSALHKKYKYFISLQPAIWRKEHFIYCLKRGEDAWATELNGARRASKSELSSYCCTSPVCSYENFYKSGKYIRNSYATYIKNNQIENQNDNQEVYVVDSNGKKSFVKLKDWKYESTNK